MSILLLFLSWIVSLLVSGFGMCLEEYNTKGDKRRANIHTAFIFVFSVAAVSMAYYAGYSAPR